jgi:hypothetical protein
LAGNLLERRLFERDSLDNLMRNIRRTNVLPKGE